MYYFSVQKQLDFHSEVIEMPSNKSFGLTMFGAFLILGLIIFSRVNWSIGVLPVGLISVAVLFFVLSFVAPAILTPFNKYWMKFGLVLHHIVNPVVMGVLFFGVVTPFALVIKVFRVDLLDLSLDKSKNSYWKEKDPVGPPPENMKNQF